MYKPNQADIEAAEQLLHGAPEEAPEGALKRLFGRESQSGFANSFGLKHPGRYRDLKTYAASLGLLGGPVVPVSVPKNAAPVATTPPEPKGKVFTAEQVRAIALARVDERIKRDLAAGGKSRS